MCLFDRLLFPFAVSSDFPVDGRKNHKKWIVGQSRFFISSVKRRNKLRGGRYILPLFSNGKYNGILASFRQKEKLRRKRGNREKKSKKDCLPKEFGLDLMKKVTLFVEYGYFICWILLSYPLEMVISFVGNGCSICWIRLFHPHFSIILPRKQPFRILLRVLSERDWLLMKQIREHYAVYSPIMQ